MTLRETIERHAKTVLNRADHFGESVTYTPLSGPAVTVRVVVDRRDVEPMEGNIRVGRLAAIVFVPKGSLAAYPQPGDQITLPMQMGASATQARVTSVIEQDEGGCTVEVQS